MLAYVGVPKIWGRYVQLQVPHKFCCSPVPLLSEIWEARAPASSMAPAPVHAMRLKPAVKNVNSA